MTAEMGNQAGVERVVVVVGPTAAGKSALAEALAKGLGGDVLSVDSMQVYKHLDVGTDKPTAEVRAQVRYHGLDLVEPGEGFDASAFVGEADRAIREAKAQGRAVIACGGTGFYVRALVEGLSQAPGRDDAARERLRGERDALGMGVMYERLLKLDPVAAKRIHPNDWVRIERALEVIEVTGRAFSSWLPSKPAVPRYDALYIGVTRPRAALYARIDARLRAMWGGGLMDEARKYVADLPKEAPPSRALGYQHALMALRGECSAQDALALAQRDTRHFARRQLIWFCAMPQIHWLYAPLSPTTLDMLIEAVGVWLDDHSKEWISPPSIPWVDDAREDIQSK